MSAGRVGSGWLSAGGIVTICNQDRVDLGAQEERILPVTVPVDFTLDPKADGVDEQTDTGAHDDLH